MPWTAFGLEDAPLRSRLMELYFVLHAYPEVPAMLGALKAAGIRTGILSNGAVSMLVAAMQSARLQDLMGEIISADAAGIYKPHPSVYQLAVDRFAVPAEKIVFVSSNTWDVAGAARFGFRVVWIARSGGQLDQLPGEPAAPSARWPSCRACWSKLSGRTPRMLIIEPSLLQLAGDVLHLCREQGLRLATAESCTGGLIAGCLTAVAGSSTVFDRGFVTYSNVAKTAELGVAAELLAKHGAVDEAVARAMAEGALAAAGVDITVAVTGIAGPDGGSPGKPVGLVHFAAARTGAETLHERHVFPGDRQQVRAATVEAALRLLARRLG